MSAVDKIKAKAQEALTSLDDKLSAYPLLVQLEEKVPNVPHLKVYVVGGAALVGLLCFYIFLGMKFICDMTGFAYPTYMSFKAIETEDKQDDKQWLTYWVVFAFMSVSEIGAGFVVAMIPYYYVIKTFFLVYLFHPKSHGAEKLYDNVLKKVMKKYEATIDKHADELAEKARRASVMAKEKAATAEAAPTAAAPKAPESTVSVVELDGLVVLKIIKHCQQALPSFVTGQLLGLDVARTLEVTNCFPFPGRETAGGDSSAADDDSAEYQMEMMRCLREVNVDNNTVGWYQSTYFSSFIDEQCVETQFNYQSNLKNCCMLIYDPSRARTSGIALRAFRLTDSFMSLYSDGKVTYDALAGASSADKGAGVFVELPIKVRSSHLSSALLLELQDECGISANAADFSRLELNTNPFLEKQLQLLIESIEDLQQESSKLQHYERAVQRQKSAQSQYLAKKKAEAVTRRARGEEPLPEEDLTHNSLFKPIPKPSRLESLLITDQMSAYCQQVNQFTGQSFAKLFLMQSLNGSSS